MPGGRPKFIVDYSLVKKLAMIQCTQQEIANFLGCSINKLEKDKEFIRVYKKHIDEGRMSLRRKQWRAADEGNTTMLVWLGKQYLGQKDKSEMDARIYAPKQLSDFYANPKAKKAAKQKAHIESSPAELLEDTRKE